MRRSAVGPVQFPIEGFNMKGIASTGGLFRRRRGISWSERAVHNQVQTAAECLEVEELRTIY